MIFKVSILVASLSNIPYKYRPGSATSFPFFSSGYLYSVIKFFSILASVNSRDLIEVGKYKVFNAERFVNKETLSANRSKLRFSYKSRKALVEEAKDNNTKTENRLNEGILILLARMCAARPIVSQNAFLKMLGAIRCALDIDHKEDGYGWMLKELEEYMLMLNNGYPFSGCSDEIPQKVQAYKDIYKLAFEYISGVLPAAALSDMIRITLDQNGYNVPIVLNELESMRDQIGDYINNPAGKEFPNISITDETGRVIVSLMPSPDDVAMQDVKNMPGWGAQSTNVAIATRIYNMLNNTINDIRKDPGTALNIYSSVNKAKQNVKDALSFEKIIAISDTEKPYALPDGIFNAEKEILAYQRELKSKANGNPALLNTVSTFDIKMYSDGLKGKSVAGQALYIQTLAQINNNVGDTDHYTRNSDFDNLSKDEQNFAKNYCMYGYIMQDNAIANKYNLKINNYLASGATIALNEIQRSAGLESIDNQVQEMRQQLQKLQALIARENHHDWFSNQYKVLSEQDILTTSGNMQRPDRVMISGKHAIVIDYKFGHEQPTSHLEQVRDYMSLLRQMGYTTEGYIIYNALQTIHSIQ